VAVRNYPYIIGNAWGKPAAMTGPEHYWVYQLNGKQTWVSGCGKHIIQLVGHFRNVPWINLTYEADPLKAVVCESCLDFYAESEIGKLRPGRRPPIIDDLEMMEGNDD
jgi:hypothetical protein